MSDDAAEMTEALVRLGLVPAGTTVPMTPLAGGVSSDIWRADLADGPVCIKRALPKLRVEADWRAPVGRNIYEARWMETVRKFLPEAVPELRAHDPDAGAKLLWKRKLGRGGIQGGVHFGLAVAGDTLYEPMSDFDGGPRWPGTPYPGMHAVVLATGEVRCFRPADDSCMGRDFFQPGLSAPASAFPGGVLSGAMDGRLRG